ncbi:hypothetical protein Scep_019733 [Stephania cephalantha]|uniref:Uncharacterized protein n=1 Tax=Stephania cephalantha TaxID=152367 RepID=A0AAP0IBC6_9MAGN
MAETHQKAIHDLTSAQDQKMVERAQYQERNMATQLPLLAHPTYPPGTSTSALDREPRKRYGVLSPVFSATSRMSLPLPLPLRDASATAAAIARRRYRWVKINSGLYLYIKPLNKSYTSLGPAGKEYTETRHPGAARAATYGER